MSTRGRSISPKPLQDADVDMENGGNDDKKCKVVVINGLSRNVVQAHLQTIFAFYGEIVKIDLPLFLKSGQNRGKAALEFTDAASAQKAVSHMNGGQLDGLIVKVELSDLPIRTRSRSRSRPRPPREVMNLLVSTNLSEEAEASDVVDPPPGTRTVLLDHVPARLSGVGTACHSEGGLQVTSVEGLGLGMGVGVEPAPGATRRSRTRSKSLSRGRRSYSRDDIRDSRSRSPV
ncbi:hypothetical protein C8R48DRAFT_675909 [Suillus tomentosus]|nr:hypothetical protein C8R48DRAFT_675909 [Suillus tomentosus]